nr:hypothetical protein [Tanacetum cinerariifolium]
VIQGDQVNIQSRNSGNTGRNNRRAYVQKEVVEGSNGTGNIQRTLQNSSLGNTLTVQCYNYSEKGHYARNFPKPRVRDSKYFMEHMLLAKQDEAGVILTDEQNDFTFADASRIEEIEDLSANICSMTRIQPTNHSSDAGPSHDSAFISEVQSSSINENEEQMYPTHTEIINSTIGDDQIDSNIIFDTPNGNVNSAVLKKIHMFLIYNDQNVVECDDERGALANLIANLILDVDENKKIQKQLKKANITLAHELTKCKSILAETSRTLGDSNSNRDSCLVALQNIQIEFEWYKALKDHTVDYDKL